MTTNKSFILLLSAVFLLSAHARHFRGVLKGSSDFAGSPHFDHKTKGNVFHRGSSDNPTKATTEAHITEDIALMLGQRLPGLIDGIKNILETQSDTGVLFCGVASPVNHLGITGIGFMSAEMSAQGHDYSDSAVVHDGTIASIVAIEEDEGQCGSSRCLPSSVVAKLAQLIRGHGFHILHSDICSARGTAGLPSVETCNLGMYTHAPEYQRAYSCPRDGTPMQWESDKLCGANLETACKATGSNCRWVTGQKKCIASDAYLDTKNCIWNWENDIGIDPSYYSTGVCSNRGGNNVWGGYQRNSLSLPLWPGTSQPAAAPLIITDSQLGFTQNTAGFCMSFVSEQAGMRPSANQIVRTLKYGGVFGRAVDIDDSVPITGDTDATQPVTYTSISGCSSLRGIVLAINGNKLAAKYVAKQHNYAETYWKGQIDDSRSIINTVREKIINLQGLGDFFYPLEKSKPFQCSAEFSAFESGIDEGSATNPKCDLAGTSYASTQGVPHTKSMGQRSTCFCRSFADSGDDFYLTTTAANSSDCDTNFKGKLPSVYTYCKKHGELGRTDEWKNTLDQLKFSASDVPTLLDTWFVGASTEIQQNFDASIVGQGTKCGRVASASTTSVAFSNKGGNCIPLEGIEQIVYRLEFEFFSPDAAVDRKGSGATYADMMCEANVAGDQVLSFRQLAYQWQNDATMVEEDTNPDTIATTNPTSQFYDNAGTLINGVLVPQYEDFCSIDYAQMLGGGRAYVEGGVAVADPLGFLKRVNGEASYNVDQIYSEASRIRTDEDVLWSHMIKHLSNTDAAHVIDKIGKKAARTLYGHSWP